MKIYTKTGDQGKTSLYGGKKVSKAALNIEAYGTLDELNSYIGLIRSFHTDPSQSKLLEDLQHIIFDLGTHLAADPEKPKLKLPDLQEAYIQTLEENIDLMDGQLTPLKQFILPGGNQEVSQIQIARTVCRRAERRIAELISNEIEIHPIILPYINRLSDYLFVLARFQAKIDGIEEYFWNPKFNNP